VVLPEACYVTKPKALNDSVPIARFLNEMFTGEDGFRFLEGVEEALEYDERLTVNKFFRPLLRWIVADVWRNALDGDERGQAYFRETREKRFGEVIFGGEKAVRLEDILELSGGEERTLQGLREGWVELRERMEKEDGSGEPTNVDFYDAGLLKWVEAASPEKYQKLLGLYGDDTFVKLVKKTEKYA